MVSFEPEVAILLNLRRNASRRRCISTDPWGITPTKL